MAFHLPEVEKITRMLKSSDIIGKIKVIVGGRPFNIDKELWINIGADGFAEDAARAIEIANELIQKL